ncbi:WD40 repeat-like protein [Pisolithus croceorrhizus]|nr:WD40 repeat-like protein [Pisolithus croceorrhizus]
MHVPQSDQSSGFSVSIDSASEAGPSFAAPMANGSTKCSSMGNGISKHSSIARVSLPGTTLYQDPYVNREEFVRLVIQSLKDVGYIGESGYSLEAPEVSEFVSTFSAEWPRAEAVLPRLVADDDSLWEALFLIGKQKYLELLETRNITAALQVLREQLAPLKLRRRALWDGASVASRQALLTDLQEFIPSAIMIPQRRFATLLTQARQYQRERCTYHNAPMNPTSFSLFVIYCDKEDFPAHDGLRLASASKDKTAIIWRIAPDGHPRDRECVVEFILRDILIRAGNVTTLDSHMDTVSALLWLPDGSGFMSASLDRKVVAWEASGKQVDEWPGVPIRAVVIGMGYQPTALSPDGLPPWGVNREPPPASGNRIVIYDFKTKATELSGELTSVKISSDSRFALVNHAPDAIHLLDLNDGHMARQVHRPTQRQHVIRSCFGGVDGNFVVSGSEGDPLGHGIGSVNCVAWNPQNERMFASCSDDCTVRIWEPLPLPAETSASVPLSITDGKGRVYSSWDDGSGDGEVQS